MKRCSLLLELARVGAHEATQKLTSKDFARSLGTSQQTAARRLADLEADGLLTRESGPKGQKVKLTRKGVAILRSVHRELDIIFGKRAHVLKLKGRIIPGAGEGAYYMSQEGYRRQFERELGFIPYRGTLDVKLDGGSLERREMLENLPGKKIEGFKTQERTFGPVKCFEAKLQDTRVVVIIPARTHHTEIIELVAPVNLRRKLKLSDGNIVSIEVII